MTCAGISSLIITGLKRFQGQEFLHGDTDPELRQGGRQPQPPARHRLAGQPLPGRPELRQRPAVEVLLPLRPGARRPAHRPAVLRRARLVSRGGRGARPRAGQARGLLAGRARRSASPVLATSFALLFLAKGRAPVLINKLRHGPRGDWNNDPDDIRNLVGVVSRDWKNLLTWQVVDPSAADRRGPAPGADRLLQRPRGPRVHRRSPSRTSATSSSRAASSSPRPAAASPEFDQGFRALMKEIFPEAEYKLHPLAEDHAVWRAKHLLVARRPPALGHRARLPHRGDLLARGPLLLLEPGRSTARPTPPSSRRSRSART